MSDSGFGKKSREAVLARLKEREISFATVSGILTTKPGMIEAVDTRIPEISVVTTKSYQVSENKGNREPIIVEPAPGCFGNAVGLRNPGMEKGCADLTALRRRHMMRAVLNVSLSGNSPDEFIRLVKKFEDIADMLELNLSCPHASGGYGMSIGTDPEIVFSYLKEIRRITAALLFPKLTPNVDCMGEIARASIEGGADGIVAVNTAGPELFIEPHSGKPVLMNSKKNRGGKSGRWIRDTALGKVEEVRAAVGPDIPIIGMGGIENGTDARLMREAGADVIGLGSVFASLDPKDWEDYFSALKNDVQTGETESAGQYISTHRQMEYRCASVKGILDLPGELRVLELETSMACDAGQFAFLWLPGIGEKPFSVAESDPLTFIIRKRGVLTSALMDLQEGESLYFRGVYGKEAPDCEKGHTWIAAGGTGIAVAPKLAKEHAGRGRQVHTYYGMSLRKQEVMEGELKKWGDYHAVADAGTPGRAVQVMMDAARPKINDSALYTIGPVRFMKYAACEFIRAGADPAAVFLSIETMTRCGVGLCGECECGGRLTCKEGTFFAMKFLQDNNIELRDFEHED